MVLIAGLQKTIHYSAPEPLTLKEYAHSLAQEHEVDWSLAKRVIHCESNWNPDAVNHDSVIGTDRGLLQINTHFHQARAEKMNYDIRDARDNLEYGIRLLAERGTRPWLASRKCWTDAL